MKKANSFLFTGLVFSLAFSSCVSYRKYEDLEAAKRLSDQELIELRGLKTSNAALLDSLSRTITEQNKTKSDLKDVTDRYEGLLKSNNDLVQRYDGLLAQSNTMLSTSSAEKQQLTEQLSIKQKELEARSKDLDKLDADIRERQRKMNEMESDLSKTKGALSDNEKKIKELSDALQAKDAVMKDLNQKVKKALAGFSSSDLSIREQDGKIYVSMSQNLLFKTGSAAIDPKGLQAIAQLAGVLNRDSEIDILVEGHTDSDGTPERNWDLSVSRAVSVTKVLVNNGVDAKRVTAAGRGIYHPVSTNATAEGKALNRRTEIILSPKLDELYNMFNKN